MYPYFPFIDYLLFYFFTHSFWLLSKCDVSVWLYVNVDFVVVVFSYKLQKPGLMKQMQDLALKWSKMEKLMFHCKRSSQRDKDMGELPGMNWGPVALDKLRLLYPHLEKTNLIQGEFLISLW